MVGTSNQSDPLRHGHWFCQFDLMLEATYFMRFPLSRIHPTKNMNQCIEKFRMFNENMPTCPIFFEYLHVSKIFPWFPICFSYVFYMFPQFFPISLPYLRVFPVVFQFLHGFPIISPWFSQAVVWYAGATASQIERSIAKAAGLGEAPIECRDGEDVVPWTSHGRWMLMMVYPYITVISGDMLYPYPYPYPYITVYIRWFSYIFYIWVCLKMLCTPKPNG